MKTQNYNYSWGGTPWQIATTRTFCRWHEAPRNVFRFVGNAHDILNLRHKGWFTDVEFQDEVTHGLVFQLPRNRFLAAGSDANNEGSAYFEVDSKGNPIFYTDKEDAARNADRIAELYAEAESEYQAKEREEMCREDEEREAKNLTEAFEFAA